jgi:hypothetical protein
MGVDVGRSRLREVRLGGLVVLDPILHDQLPQLDGRLALLARAEAT